MWSTRSFFNTLLFHVEYTAYGCSRKGSPFVVLPWQIGIKHCSVLCPRQYQNLHILIKALHQSVCGTWDSEHQHHQLLAWYHHICLTQPRMWGKPAQIWHHNAIESGGVYSFVPVRYLKCGCAFSTCICNTMEESVLLVVPIIDHEWAPYLALNSTS